MLKNQDNSFITACSVSAVKIALFYLLTESGKDLKNYKYHDITSVYNAFKYKNIVKT